VDDAYTMVTDTVLLGDEGDGKFTIKDLPPAPTNRGLAREIGKKTEKVTITTPTPRPSTSIQRAGGPIDGSSRRRREARRAGCTRAWGEHHELGFLRKTCSRRSQDDRHQYTVTGLMFLFFGFCLMMICAGSSRIRGRDPDRRGLLATRARRVA